LLIGATIMPAGCYMDVAKDTSTSVFDSSTTTGGVTSSSSSIYPSETTVHDTIVPLAAGIMALALPCEK